MPVAGQPGTESDVIQAYRAKAWFDAFGDDPKFGYRFLVDETADTGKVMAERATWRICSTNGLFSPFCEKPMRDRGGIFGPPVHYDFVQRHFTVLGANELWLADISKPRTLEGKPYVCAIKDLFSNRLVSYLIDFRMKSLIVVTALNSAIARRDDVAGWVPSSDSRSQLFTRKSLRSRARYSMVGSMGRVGAAGDNVTH